MNYKLELDTLGKIGTKIVFMLFAVDWNLSMHQGGRKPWHIKMTLFGLYLISFQPHLSFFESF
jgi:hypothetical protein